MFLEAERSLIDFCELINQTFEGVNSLNCSQADDLAYQRSNSYNNVVPKSTFEMSKAMHDAASEIEILQRVTFYKKIDFKYSNYFIFCVIE